MDYCTDVLVNEQLHTLQKIISDLVAPTIKKEMLHGLGIIQNFLKYQYDEHAKMEGDEVHAHCNNLLF